MFCVVMLKDELKRRGSEMEGRERRRQTNTAKNRDRWQTNRQINRNKKQSESGSRWVKRPQEQDTSRVRTEAF